ncbi:MAG: outer membrane lipoprotein-sorting protein [Oligoflexia bacterium]|nr:outer membrane lipoprotein-sorting protein [Oligoflexia bacterium]
MPIGSWRVYQSTLVFLGLCALAGAPGPASAAPKTPEQCLALADAIRNPGETYKMRVQISSEDSEQVLDVTLKGRDKTLIATRAPARDLGRNMLMLDRDFYAYVPNLKRSVRLSLAQKLLGQVANGDIARTRWSGDYRASYEKATAAKELQLLLDGVKPNLTYQKIRLWTEEDTCRPLRAEYLSLDGRSVLKTAAFEAYQPLAGQERPTRIRIRDTGGKTSTIAIRSMETVTLSDSFFTEKNMETVR